MIIPQIRKLIKEILIEQLSHTGLNTGTWEGGTSDVDDGPRYFWGNQASYKKYNDQMAAKLGFSVTDYLSGDKELPTYDTNYPNGPTGAVTYFPAGIDDPTVAAGSNILGDQRGEKAYKMWIDNLDKILKN